MAHQIQQIRHRFYPKLSVWRGNYQHGSWLLNFLALLDNLPSKTPQQDEAKLKPLLPYGKRPYLLSMMPTFSADARAATSKNVKSGMSRLR